jgi:hypothetical protein
MAMSAILQEAFNVSGFFADKLFKAMKGMPFLLV